MRIHLAVQFFAVGTSVAEKHQPPLRSAPPGDQFRCSCQNMIGQNLRGDVRPQSRRKSLKKPHCDRLARAQVRRLMTPALYLVQRGKGSAAFLIKKHCLFQTEDSVISDSNMSVHDCSSRVITPSSLPGIKSISRLAAASVSHATPNVRKPRH